MNSLKCKKKKQSTNEFQFILDLFFFSTFACPILEGYGLTENFAGALITHTNETQLGHVGSVLKCTEFKLQDIPEMDYSTSSNPPKGEILLRGPNIFREYYKDEKQTYV